REKDFIFMNYGHHEIDSAEEKKREESYLKKKRSFFTTDNSAMARLYFYLCEEFPSSFEGKNIVEVGSGRGGGARFISENYPIISFMGFDLSLRNIEYCNNVNSDSTNLSFKKGDAENLPLPNSYVDIVLNVESSHCYPNFEKFIEEVSRVLKKGGYFIFADFRPPEKFPELEETFEEKGLKLAIKNDITKNVLMALDYDSDQRISFIKRFTPKIMFPVMKIFSGVKGTLVYKKFQDKDLCYFYYVLSKDS
ncbi:MAG: class I SAM-dependent methyltransferase, partial [Bdellovibrionota bacterium]|nr:class I SAM-dependent methyltransferase [Bdellovibrionota bacterium]